MEKKEIIVYEKDASQIKGVAKKVLFPKTIEEVCSIVKLNEHLTIRGGGSGLAGGCVPQNDVVLDLSKMDKIIEINPDKMSVIVEAGVILNDLENFLRQYNLEFPVNPSSHEICTIGGMIATNAVGSRAIKYGKTSNWVLWLDVVSSNGKVERVPKTDLQDYCGKEGITGVIVRACLKLIKAKKRYVEILEFEKLNEIIEKVRELKKEENVSGIEFISKKISKIFNIENKYLLIVEKEIEDLDEKKKKESERIMRLRESLFPILAKEGYTVIEDPKVSLDRISLLIEWLEERNVPVFGHIGSGILHPQFSKENKKYIEEMMQLVKKLNGSITGEHGVGLLKKDFVDVNDKKMLFNIKKRIDPDFKFNRNKVV